MPSSQIWVDIVSWFKDVKSRSGTRNQNSRKGVKTPRELFIKNNPCPHAVYLSSFYSEGYGFKTIARESGLTYMESRKLLDYCDVDRRTGTNCITPTLRKSRSDRAKGERNPWRNWPEKNPGMHKTKNARGVQGFFVDRLGRKVWLRSSFEYIFAKWLDSQNAEWQVEVSQFYLPSGRYRPDFFIFQNGILSKIIEIKGTYYQTSSERLQKTKELQDHLSGKIEVSVIEDIRPFIEKGSTYNKELEKWKAESKASR